MGLVGKSEASFLTEVGDLKHYILPKIDTGHWFLVLGTHDDCQRLDQVHLSNCNYLTLHISHQNQFSNLIETNIVTAHMYKLNSLKVHYHLDNCNYPLKLGKYSYFYFTDEKTTPIKFKLSV